MADARTLSVTYSGAQGRARPLPWVQAPALFTTGRALLPSSSSAAFALPHPDSSCSYHQRGGRLFDRAELYGVSAHGTSELGIQK
jgi:hypothetical protein